MAKIILRASDLDGYLTQRDRDDLREMQECYDDAMSVFVELDRSATQSQPDQDGLKRGLIDLYNKMGDMMHGITNREKAIHVYSFETPQETHGEASRLIAKLRDQRTGRHEFTYYTQRAYELLFNLAVSSPPNDRRNYIINKTPVTSPVQNYSVHKIPDVDAETENAVMCVMLRGALLPSMIMSKEIQEYSSFGHLTPFALFHIKRDDTKKERDMVYTLDLERSFFDIDSLQGKDLVFADPMNATGGSLVTIVKYLMDEGVQPRSIKCFNVISALKGALRIIRALDKAVVYTLWMDPVLNESAYIMPGLGDAGDRLNGVDFAQHPRNIIQLIADYGSNIAELYRAQVRKIEETVLGT